MTELETLQTEVSALENQLSDLENQIKEKKHSLTELKYSQQPIFAQRLRKARLNAELTQEQLAEKLSIAQITLTQYERAVIEPSFQNLTKIADSLNVSLDWLCGRTEKIKIEGTC